MAEPFILGDWGTTSCRLHLIDGGRARDGVAGPGVARAREQPGGLPAVYAGMVAGWEARHGPLRALLCGTVGANIGWVDAGYLGAPARVSDFYARRVRTERDGVDILPGVMVEANAFGQPDVMRSEEMQVFGWLAATERTKARLCLPGTHTKWVEVADSAIVNFTSSCVGELFGAIRTATILAPARGEGAGAVVLGEAFADGVALAARHPALVSALFSIRAEAALNRLSAADSRDRMSGLLIGADCHAMLQQGHAPDAVVGAPALAAAYQRALRQIGHEVEVADGQDAVLAGLLEVVRQGTVRQGVRL